MAKRKTAPQNPEIPSGVPINKLWARTDRKGADITEAISTLKAEETKSIVSAVEGGIFRQHRLFTRMLDIDLFCSVVFGTRTQIAGQPSAGKTLIAINLIAALQKTCRLCYTPIITWVDDWSHLRPVEGAAEGTTETQRKTWQELWDRWRHGDTTAFKHKTKCLCGQNAPMKVLFVNTEDSFDPYWASIWGVDVGDFAAYNDCEVESDSKGKWSGLRASDDGTLLICQPSSSTMIENVLNALIRSGSIDAIIIDSVASIAPTEDIEGKERTASRARFLSRLWPIILSAQIEARMKHGARITIITTNQYRQTMASYPGANPNQAATGYAQKYAMDTNIRIQSSKINSFSEKQLERVMTRDVLFKLDKLRGTIMGEGAVRFHLDDCEIKPGVVVRAGTTDEVNRLFKYLLELNNPKIAYVEKVGDRTKATWIYGRPFKTRSEVIAFLDREDIRYQSRFILFANKLGVSGRMHLRKADYLGNPHADFIEEVINDENQKVGQLLQQSRSAISANQTGPDPAEQTEKE